MTSDILQLTEHFRLTEFMCPCCQRIKVVNEFEPHVDMLQEMRDRLGYGVHVTSGYRCDKHNKAVGGAKNSMHRRFATDVQPTDRDPEKLREMIALAEQIGFTGIGTYKSWVHLDVRPGKARWQG